MNDLLLEFNSEEMPASELGAAIKIFHDLIKVDLANSNITFKNSKYYFTPTRITFVFYELRNTKVHDEIFVRGPHIDAPEKALEGFARSNGIDKKSLIKKKTKKGIYYFYKVNKKTNKIETKLGEIIKVSLNKFVWKKSMRWGFEKCRWVRPLKNILCIYNGKIVKFQFFNFESTNLLYVRKKTLIKKYKIKSVKKYFEILQKESIEVDQNRREEIIIKKAEDICKIKKLKFNFDKQLVQEVANLVETPYLFLAKFKLEYLKLPNEVLITSMQKHQKYFPLFTIDNTLSNIFLLVSNLKPKDKGKMIIAGNERVINARLSDAQFFWNKDLSSNFRKENKKLNTLIFHNEIGTVKEKTERLNIITSYLSKSLNLKTAKLLSEASTLCKNDLVSETVREFPNLQGIMGKYLILNAKGSKEVACAIEEHYKPQGPADSIPKTLLSKYLSLADKVDSLTGFFIINKNPTGSKDPFALRRTALGVVRVLIEGKINLDLSKLIDVAINAYIYSCRKKKLRHSFKEQEIKKKVIFFLLERYENLIKEGKKIDFNVYNSLIVNKKILNLLEVNTNGELLTNYVNSKEGKIFMSSIKRVINIINNDLFKTQEIKRPKVSLLTTKEELRLFELLNMPYKDLSLNNALSYLNKLSLPIRNFFDNVTIKDKNITLRQNRINLLNMINKKVNELTDFSMIIKGKE